MANIKVKRANVILTVPDYQQAEYLAKGFDVIGANGKVLIRTTPNDINGLKKAYTELTARVAELEAENKQLKEQLASKGKKVEKVKDEPEENADAPEEFTPINKRGPKKTK
ncbi:MAG: hypothetical protein J6M44_14450 [Butyrivibrio sp.]|nr:hypothetical protein [Butyrivibrio sp.]